MNMMYIALLSLLFVLVAKAQYQPANCSVYTASCAYLWDCSGKAQRCSYTDVPTNEYLNMCNSIGGIFRVDNECRTSVDLLAYAGSVQYSNSDCTGNITGASLTLTNTCQRIISSLYYRVRCNGTQLITEQFGPACSYDDVRGPTTYQDLGCFDGTLYYCDIDECATNASACPEGIKCINTVGSYICNGTKEYFITSEDTGLVMTGGRLGRKVEMAAQKSDDFDDQLWSYIPSQGGYIVNKRTGYALDVKSGTVYPGVELVTSIKRATHSSWSNNQRWNYNATTLNLTCKVDRKVFDVKTIPDVTNATVILEPHKKKQHITREFVLVESN